MKRATIVWRTLRVSNCTSRAKRSAMLFGATVGSALVTANVFDLFPKLPWENAVLCAAADVNDRDIIMHQIDSYVDSILGSKLSNIPGIPDEFERSLYRSVIKLVLGAIESGIGMLDGAEILGHRLVVQREQLAGIPVSSVDVNEEALKSLVRRLLSQSFAGAINLELVGHRLSVALTAISEADLGAARSDQRSAISESVVDALVMSAVRSSGSSALPDALERQMLKTAYTLVLCSMEEVFRDIRLEILRSKLRVHLAGPDDPAAAAAAARRKVDRRVAAAEASASQGSDAARAAMEMRLREVAKKRAALEAEDKELRTRLAAGQSASWPAWVWWVAGAASVAGVGATAIYRSQ